jgi:hypothetical protein
MLPPLDNPPLLVSALSQLPPTLFNPLLLVLVLLLH